MEFTVGLSLTLAFVVLFFFGIAVMPMLHDVLEQRRFRREVDAYDRKIHEPPRWSAEATRRRVHAAVTGRGSTPVDGKSPR